MGAINVRDGIVSATTGTAIKNSKTGVITVGGTAEVTSQNTAWNGGTIYFFDVLTTGVILKVEDTAQVKNTAAEEGYSAFFYPLNLTPVTVKNYYTVAEGAKLGNVYPMPPKNISFDARNGDTIADVEIRASMQLPSNPSRWGYDFDGWYDGIDGTDAPEGLDGKLTLEKAKALSAGIKVYAKWTKDGKTLRTAPLDLTGAVTAAPDQGWTWDADKKILTLNGATIMSENSIGSTGSSSIELYAVKLPTGATITLAEGSKSDIIGGNCISSDAVDIRSCGIYVNDATSGILTINGTGTLNTRGGGVFYNQAGESCGIFSADKINIVSGTVNATGGTVSSTYTNTNTFSSSIGISTDQLSAVAVAIGKDAILNAIGGRATYTCKNDPSDGFAMSDGISSTENISNDGTLTVVGDIAICNGADGKRISDNEKSYGTFSDTATFSATAVTLANGKTAAISTINGITANKAFIIGANETSFTSGTTKTLTQADQTVPVEIVFTKAVTFDARNGAATEKVETDGETIIMPANPKWGDNAAKDNYTFAGWYTGIDGAGDKFVNENLAVRTKVYAKWTKDGKTVRTEALDLSTATESIDKLDTEGWSWDNSSSTLTLKGAIIRRDSSVGAIGTGTIELYAVKLPPVATINLVEGSENSLIGGNCTGSNASDIKSFGIYANEYSDVNTLTINGTGTLNTR
ncbi:MAG: InlB B-repeat-containing protein, partial [Oscillospiraceae bacterium]